jgi:hypothetical protein
MIGRTLGEVRATTGGVRSLAVPEFVKVSAKPVPRTVSTPAGCQVAWMMIWPFTARSQYGSGVAPDPVSVQ